MWHGSHAHVETHGFTADGEFFVAPLTDTFCGAAGARAFADGVDMGGEIPNIVSRWANVESQELNTPHPLPLPPGGARLGRPRQVPRRRLPRVRVHAERRARAIGLVLFGKGTRAPMSLGIFGGYPGCNVGYTTFRQANLGDLPDRFDELRGSEQFDQFWGTVDLHDGDVQYVRFMGGGGYGDPLDRDPELVLKDVLAGLVTDGPAGGIYGVVIAAGAVDAEATRVRRRELRAERLGRPFDGADERTDVARTGKRLGEYLQRTDGDATQCTWCGTEVAAGGDATGRITPSCGACPSRRPAPTAPPRASSS